jgi:glycosyltransferase involved in cell wall biosynthesis
VRISVTAVIPTFDRPGLLVRAVASVQGQSSPADAIIVVDNGVSAVPADLLPPEVRLLRIAARAGVSAARNAGARAAHTEYVAFLDDDDRWDIDYLRHVRAAISQPGPRPDVVIGRKDREVDGVVAPYKQITSLVGIRDVLMVKNPGVGGQNLTVRAGFFASGGCFRVELCGGNDRAFLVDAIDLGAHVRLAPDAIVVKVIHEGEQITDGHSSVRNTTDFMRAYWRSMSWSQRRRNVRKLGRAVLLKGRRLRRSLLGTRQ